MAMSGLGLEVIVLEVNEYLYNWFMKEGVHNAHRKETLIKR